MAAGLGVNPAGNRLVVVNLQNDSVSLIDLDLRVKVAEQDLRPGLIDPSESGVPGGEYPFDVIFNGNDKAYVSSQRDRELVALAIQDNSLRVTKHISVKGQPNHMVLNRAGTRLYVACDNSDTVAIVDTAFNKIVEQITTTAPRSVFPNHPGFKGSNPNNLALSPDKGTLFVTNGGTNSAAVIQLGMDAIDPALASARQTGDDEGDNEGAAIEDRAEQNQVIGLIPTGWYPDAVDGTHLRASTRQEPKACANPV